MSQLHLLVEIALLVALIWLHGHHLASTRAIVTAMCSHLKRLLTLAPSPSTRVGHDTLGCLRNRLQSHPRWPGTLSCVLSTAGVVILQTGVRMVSSLGMTICLRIWVNVSSMISWEPALLSGCRLERHPTVACVIHCRKTLIDTLIDRTELMSDVDILQRIVTRTHHVFRLLSICQGEEVCFCVESSIWNRLITLFASGLLYS